MTSPDASGGHKYPAVYALSVAEPTVHELYERRRPPFIVAAALLAIVSVAVARLPDSLVNSIERERFLNDASAGWAYRLLAFVAVAQGLFGGFYVFRIDHVKRSRAEDPKVATMTRARVLTSLSRNAAGMVLLTLAYGLAVFGVTGERGGFWLFPFLCVLQALWYFRELGAVARWLGFQPDLGIEHAPEAEWKRAGPDYCPPIARTLVPLEPPAPAEEPATTL